MGIANTSKDDNSTNCHNLLQFVTSSMSLTTDFGEFAVEVVEGIFIVVAEWNWSQVELLHSVVVGEVVNHVSNRSILVWCLR